MKTKSRYRKLILSSSNCDKLYCIGKRAKWEFLFKGKISMQ